MAEQESIQQQTKLKNSPPQQPHTFAISLNASAQTKKLQKNVVAPFGLFAYLYDMSRWTFRAHTICISHWAVSG